MDLIPTPDQVVSAFSNLARLITDGGLADLTPMPRDLIDRGDHREVYRYHPDSLAAPLGDPVLLVSPLAAPSSCFDLRRGCSLVEDLVQQGRPTYLVEYGGVDVRDRDLGMDHFVNEVIPAAIRRVSEDAGDRPVHVVGWSLGGHFALLAAAGQPRLPIASLAALGSPADLKPVPLLAPPQQVLEETKLPLLGLRLPVELIPDVLARPLAFGQHLDDAEYLAQVEAVNAFTKQMTAYQGRRFGQVYHRYLKTEVLSRLSSIKTPVLIVAGNTDRIAPLDSVRAMLPLLTNCDDAQLEIVTGGHLGMLAGRGARETTWAALDDWFEQWTGAAMPAPAVKAVAAAKKTTRKRAPAKKSTPVKKAPSARKVATKTAAPKKPAAKKPTPKKTVVTKATAKKKAPTKPAPVKKTVTKKAPAKGASVKQVPPTKSPARKSPARKSPARKSAARKSPAKRAASAQKVAERSSAGTTASDSAIGTNPDRRYRSTNSRSLSS